MAGLLETLLAPGFIHRDGYGVGQVQAAAAFAHRQAQAVLAVQCVEHFRRQTTAFRTEDKGIALGKLNVVKRL